MRWIVIAAVALGAIVGCGRDAVGPENPAYPSIVLHAPQNLLVDVTRVTVTVTGPGMSTITRDLAIQGTQATGTLSVPAGESRTFSVEARNSQGTVVAAGSATRSLDPGSSPTIDIPLTLKDATVTLVATLTTTTGVAGVTARVSGSGMTAIERTLTIQGTQATGTLTVPSGPGRVFVVEAKNASGGVLASETRTVSLEPGSVSTLPFTLVITTRTDLVYDDGAPESGFALDSYFVGCGVRMTAPHYPAKIVSLRYYLTNLGGTGRFYAAVLDYDQQPFDLPMHDPVYVTASATGWIDVDVSARNLIVQRDFVVGMFYDGVNEPSYGYDPQDNGRSWDYTANLLNGELSWVSFGEYTYFIRATVELAGGQLVTVAP